MPEDRGKEIRHAVVRCGYATDVMLVLVINSQRCPMSRGLLPHFAKGIPSIQHLERQPEAHQRLQSWGEKPMLWAQLWVIANF